MLTNITSGDNKTVKEEQAMGLSKGEMVVPADQQEGSRRFTKRVGNPAEVCGYYNQFSEGEQVLAEVQAAIKRDIVLNLVTDAKYYEVVNLNRDNYAKFSRDIMKYVGKHY